MDSEKGSTFATVNQLGVLGKRQPSSFSTTARLVSGLGGGDQLSLSTGQIPVSTFFEDEDEEDEEELEEGMEKEEETDESEGSTEEYEGVRYLVFKNHCVISSFLIPAG